MSRLVLVAMSGGVDSSAAALQTKKGDPNRCTIGATLRLHEYNHARNGCAEENIRDAKEVCQKIDICHYVLDRRLSFRKTVLAEFADQYRRGMTPSPCHTCNKTMKFGHLLRYAKALGAEEMVTGHYARRLVNPTSGLVELHRASQLERDQSYFLFHLSYEELSYLRFPLGDQDKPSIRRYAEAHGLCVADKPDSQDICFVPEGEKYQKVVEEMSGTRDVLGDIVDTEGRFLGRHQGITRYTVGQRKGLNLADGPWFVHRIDSASHRVVVCRREELRAKKIKLFRTSWLEEPLPGELVTVKMRASQEPVPAHWDRGSQTLILSSPEEPAAPGQICALYRETRILGGGWIEGCT